MIRKASRSLHLFVERDGRAVDNIGSLGLFQRFKYNCANTNGTELRVQYNPVPGRIYHQHVQLSALNQRNYSSYHRIKETTVLSANNMRKLLKEYVGAGPYSEASKHPEATYNSEVKSQDELVTRSMKDSVREAVIPLGDDLNVRDKYLTFHGTVRIGKLMEDMDTLAGLVGYKFYQGPSKCMGMAPFALVTACVDKFDIKESHIGSDKNIWMTGFVSYAGKTSLEITIHLDQDNDTSRKRIAEAAFVMVARDPDAQKGAIVNRLVPATKEEREINEKSKIIRTAKKLTTERSVFKSPPTADERKIIHELFLNTLDPRKSTFHGRVKPENAVWMEETRLKNLIICHPQSRNVYNKIFGGFLMREAFELGWATTCVHTKSRPTIVCMDDINFQKPVEVGSLLYLSSQIVFTEGNYLQTRVHAEVLDPMTGHIDTTNVFHYHFTSKQDFPDVIPMSYGEYMLYIEGLRHYVSYNQTQEAEKAT